jgi:glycosyltransferase involved in cell wall biosynthesis
MTALPTFSVVVPTYRRPTRLADCLHSLEKLDYPHDRFEVVVVDDGSGAPPDPGCVSVDVRVIAQPHAGPATARNTGAARARGDYLAFTDDDCQPEPDWLREFAAHLEGATDLAVGGRTVNALAENPYASATQLLVDYLSEWTRASGQGAFFASNNLAVPTELFRARGGFDTGFPLAAGEDREFCDRWVRLGGRLSYAPRAMIRHSHHLTLPGYWRQHVNYGRGALRYHRLRAQIAFARPPATPLSFYLRLVACPLTRARGGRRFSLTALLALAQIATAMGYWRERLAKPGHQSAVPRS